MKAYHKRLLKVFGTIAALTAVCALLFNTLVNTDISRLNIPAYAGAVQVNGIGRQAGTVPSRAEMDAQGYVTQLPEGFVKQLENDSAVLYFHPETAAVALQQKSTGQLWFSNPVDIEKETFLNGPSKKRLMAQIVVSYYNSEGGLMTLDSANDCLENEGGMSFQVTGDCLEVSYRIGKITVTIDQVPQQISEERFEQFVGRLDEKSQADMRNQYALATLEGKAESVRESLIKKYPNIENNPVYYLRFDSNRVLTKVKGYWDACGYTTEDLAFDNRENGITTEVQETVFFHIVLEYRLEGNSLTASIDTQRMDFNQSVPPNEISLLSMFGAGSAEDMGYIMVPDGSGALIAFNNGKTKEAVFSMPIYGKNTASGTAADYIVGEQVSLPVFGIKNGQAAFLAEVSEGAALGRIEASVQGQQNSFNSVGVIFTTVASEVVQIAPGSRQMVNEGSPYEGRLELTFTPLEEERADYSGMAAAYRSRLLERGQLQMQEAAGAYPFVADILGGVQVQETLLGFPVNRTRPLTTFSQTQEILEELLAQGVGGVNLKLEGWFNGGLEQATATKVEVEKALGGKQGFGTLQEYCNSRSIGFFPQVYFNDIFTTRGFQASKQNIRGLNRDIVVRYEYDYVSRYRKYNNRLIYQLSPAFLASHVEAFLAESEPLKLGGLSLSDLTDSLYADYSLSQPYNRGASQKMAEQALSTLGQGHTLLASRPNAYALEYTSLAADVPCESSLLRICDESIPFYQMVIRGSMDYVAPALNYAADHRTALLQAVEYGAGLQYVLTYSRTSVLKDTDFQYINKGYYLDWVAVAAESYREAARVLEPVQGQEMVGHERLADGIYASSYANGCRIYVNYTDSEWRNEEVSVPAKGFVLKGDAG